MQKLKTKRQLVEKIKWKQTDGQDRSLANEVGNERLWNCD